MRIGVVYGGTSSEAGASEKNAKAIEKVLCDLKYEAYLIPFKKNLIEELRRKKIDLVYVCVQGKDHGDGATQAILTHEDLPYTENGPQAAALINDKILCKLLFDKLNIRTPRWTMLTKEQYRKGEIPLKDADFPVVAKAPLEGGSFGIELIRSKDEISEIEKVFAYGDVILLEQFIVGEFYTIGVLERHNQLRILPCVKGIEIRDGKTVSKKGEMTRFTGDYGVEKPKLPQGVLDEMEELTARTFQAVNARDVARVDFMLDERQIPYVLEINAVPGLKPESLLPGEAAAAGISYENLIETIMLAAWERATEGR